MCWRTILRWLLYDYDGGGFDVLEDDDFRGMIVVRFF